MQIYFLQTNTEIIEILDNFKILPEKKKKNVFFTKNKVILTFTKGNDI